jgi:hypothetical protein
VIESNITVNGTKVGEEYHAFCGRIIWFTTPKCRILHRSMNGTQQEKPVISSSLENRVILAFGTENPVIKMTHR